MKTKKEIVTNWLPRYTDTPVEEFGKYILLTNFISYVHEFARIEQAELRGRHRPMQTVTSSDGEVFRFEVDAFKKHCLLNGLDDIGLTLENAAPSIDAFEAEVKTARPWV